MRKFFKNFMDGLSIAGLVWALVIIVRGFGQMGKEIVEFQKDRRGNKL